MKINVCCCGHRVWSCFGPQHYCSSSWFLACSFRRTSASGLLLRETCPHPQSRSGPRWPLWYFHESTQSHIWLWELLLNFFPLCKGACQSCSQQISSWTQGLAQSRCSLCISQMNSGLTNGWADWGGQSWNISAYLHFPRFLERALALACYVNPCGPRFRVEPWLELLSLMQ